MGTAKVVRTKREIFSADYVVHTHDAACYDASGVLACTLPEKEIPAEGLHTHDQSCLNEAGERICGKAEVLQHQHGENCFESAEDSQETELTREEQEQVKTAEDRIEALPTGEELLAKASKYEQTEDEEGLTVYLADLEERLDEAQN